MKKIDNILFIILSFAIVCSCALQNSNVSNSNNVSMKDAKSIKDYSKYKSFGYLAYDSSATKKNGIIDKTISYSPKLVGINSKGEIEQIVFKTESNSSIEQSANISAYVIVGNFVFLQFSNATVYSIKNYIENGAFYVINLKTGSVYYCDAFKQVSIGHSITVDERVKTGCDTNNKKVYFFAEAKNNDKEIYSLEANLNNEIVITLLVPLKTYSDWNGIIVDVFGNIFSSNWKYVCDTSTKTVKLPNVTGTAFKGMDEVVYVDGANGDSNKYYFSPGGILRGVNLTGEYSYPQSDFYFGPSNGIYDMTNVTIAKIGDYTTYYLDRNNAQIVTVVFDSNGSYSVSKSSILKYNGSNDERLSYSSLFNNRIYVIDQDGSVHTYLYSQTNGEKLNTINSRYKVKSFINASGALYFKAIDTSNGDSEIFGKINSSGELSMDIVLTGMTEGYLLTPIN